jgi:hypothetical protein
MGHKRMWRSFETPRKSAAPQDDDKCAGLRHAEAASAAQAGRPASDDAGF